MNTGTPMTCQTCGKPANPNAKASVLWIFQDKDTAADRAENRLMPVLRARPAHIALGLRIRCDGWWLKALLCVLLIAISIAAVASCSRTNLAARTKIDHDRSARQ